MCVLYVKCITLSLSQSNKQIMFILVHNGWLLQCAKACFISKLFQHKSVTSYCIAINTVLKFEFTMQLQCSYMYVKINPLHMFYEWCSCFSFLNGLCGVIFNGILLGAKAVCCSRVAWVCDYVVSHS